MNDAIVTAKKLSHRYSKHWAIKDINLSIDSNKITGLLGSNGAGKSTLMNIFCGVLFPTRGEVLVNGISLRDEPLQAKQQLGFLPQQAPLYPELTVDEYLLHCAELRKINPSTVEAAVELTKEKVGIANFSKRLIGNLSGGYRQRVGIAQAIIHDPALVVLDEPTNGLDPNQILAVRGLIKEIARDRTVVLSTHILSEVEAICDDIKMIESGNIVFEGSIGEFANVIEPNSLIATFGDPPTEAAIGLIDGVDGASYLTPKKARIIISGGVDAVERLICCSVESHWRIQEISFERYSLEEVFAQLSQYKPAR